jgi:hypothetical protein
MIIPFIPFATYSPIIFSISFTIFSFFIYFNLIDIYPINFDIPEIIIPPVITSVVLFIWEWCRFYSNIRKYYRISIMVYNFCKKKIKKIYTNTIIVFKHVLSKLYYNLMLNVTLIGKLFNENWTVKFYDELPTETGKLVAEVLDTILALLSQYLSNRKADNSDVDMTDPNEDEPSPGGGGPDPGSNGDDSEPEDNDSKKRVDKGKGKAIEEEISEQDEYNKTKIDKGKGKAKAATPEELPEELPEVLPEEMAKESQKELTDFDKKYFKDLERAKFNSLNEGTYGESSRDGATLVEREQEQARLDSLKQDNGQSSTQGASSGPNESAETQGASLGPNESAERKKEVVLSYDDFRAASEQRMAIIRAFNNITETLTSENSKLDAVQRQALVEQSVGLKKDVQSMDTYIAALKDYLFIPSNDRGYDSTSNEESGEYSSSSEEESRPNKRSKK